MRMFEARPCATLAAAVAAPGRASAGFDLGDTTLDFGSGFFERLCGNVRCAAHKYERRQQDAVDPVNCHETCRG